MDDLSAFHTMLNDLRFWNQIHRDSKRTVYCAPAQAEDIRRAVEDAGMKEILTVVASRIVPDGTTYVLDVQAIEAGQREAMDIAMRNMRIWP
ncbi:hypothetical protein [Streptosporangium roseum]|uniref:hypothetical protein n=1 Tax=Streptosporangium roseum TaxID=2001 RepID=UPI0004CDA0E0|nr:hypothetical protein [Streptosporangium roseum]